MAGHAVPQSCRLPSSQLQAQGERHRQRGMSDGWPECRLPAPGEAWGEASLASW